MKVDIFGVEEKSFKDKKDGSDIVYYRAYGYKPTKRETVHGALYCELKIDRDCYDIISSHMDNFGVLTGEFEFDENGRVIDWVVL